MQILADKIIADAANAFAGFGEVTLFEGRRLESALLKRADILLIRSVTPIDAERLKDTPVKFVGTATAGVDHVNLESLQDAQIEFASAPGCNANAVAEFIATSVVTFCVKEDLRIEQTQVAIIGHGAVGTRVENKLQSLGFDCVLNDPLKAQHAARNNIGPDYVSLDAALKADIVTLHTPLTTEGSNPTANLIDAKRINSMPQCRLLINAARGGIVDEDALAERLIRDPAFNAQIDCWQNEPRIDLELIAKTFRASPHVAGHSVEARHNATAMLVDALTKWLGQQSDIDSSGHDVSLNWGKGLTAEKVVQQIKLLPVSIDSQGTVPALAQLLDQCCPVDAIDAAMRGIRDLPADRAAVEFDRLRRQFATRREFTCYKLPIERSEGLAQNNLRALGFRLPQ